MKIIDFKNKSIELLAKERQESFENGKICYICKEKFENKYFENKEHCKVTNHVIDNNSLFLSAYVPCNKIIIIKVMKNVTYYKAIGKKSQ